MALFGTGVAAADDYAGQTYADASSAASDAGLTVVVAGRVGDKLSQDECLVTRSQTAPFASANDGAHYDSQVQFYSELQRRIRVGDQPRRLVGQPGGPGSQGRRGRGCRRRAAVARRGQHSRRVAVSSSTPG